jgi:hypothetical protein
VYDYLLEVLQADDEVGQHGPASLQALWWLSLPLVE